MFTENIGIKRYFSVQRFVFAVIGMDPTSEEKTITNPVLFYVPVIALTSLCVVMFQYSLENIRDVKLVTDSLSPFCSAFLALFKYAIFMYKRKDMVRLVKRLGRLNMEASESEHHILAAENGRDITFCFWYHIFVLTTGCMALVGPILLTLIVYFKDGILHWEVPLKASYPFDFQNFGFFLLGLFWNILGVYFIIYGSVSIDSLFSWCMHNTLAQFRILHLRFRTTAERQNGDPSLEDIRLDIEFHGTAIEAAETLNSVFDSVILLKFTISCVQICCLGYQVSRVDTTVEMAFHGTFLLSVASELILYCYGGQRLKDESEAVATAIYASFPWHNMSPKVQKLLLVPMVRARRVCNLSGFFFTLDLNLYLWVFRTASSYITLLWTLDSKQ